MAAFAKRTVIFTLLGLCGCSAQLVGTPSPLGGGNNVEAMKPSDKDFAGLAGNFSGHWRESSCSYVQDKTTSDACTVDLTINQDSSSIAPDLTIMTGATGYHASLKSALVKNNDLVDFNGSALGKIGLFAAAFYENTLGEITVKIINNQELDLLIMRLPATSFSAVQIAATEELNPVFAAI